MFTVFMFWLLSSLHGIYESAKTIFSCLGEIKGWYNYLCRPKVVASVQIAVTTTTASGDSTTKSVLVPFDQPGPLPTTVRE